MLVERPWQHMTTRSRDHVSLTTLALKGPAVYWLLRASVALFSSRLYADLGLSATKGASLILAFKLSFENISLCLT